MPHEPTLHTVTDEFGASPESVIEVKPHRMSRRRARWSAASAEFIEALQGAGTGDPLLFLAGSFASASDADLACVVAPRAGVPGDELDGAEAVVVQAAHGGSAGQVEGKVFLAAGSLCGRVFATGLPLCVDGPACRTLGPESLLMFGPTMVVPLGPCESGSPILALTASRPRGAPPFTGSELESAADFACLAQSGLQLVQIGTNEARLAVLSDRDRIARELHDRVIQRVFAAGLTIQALGGMTTDPVLGRRLADQVGALDAVIAEIRTAIFALSIHEHRDRPSVRRRVLDLLDELGPLFVHPPRVLFSGAIDLLVAAPLADDLIAVLREGLINVVKHAGARDADVSVSALADTLTVEVTDTGVGLSGSKRSSGVANLSARAERWQGTVSLTDAATGGVRLSWTARLTDDPVRAVR